MSNDTFPFFVDAIPASCFVTGTWAVDVKEPATAPVE